MFVISSSRKRSGIRSPFFRWTPNGGPPGLWPTPEEGASEILRVNINTISVRSYNAPGTAKCQM